MKIRIWSALFLLSCSLGNAQDRKIMCFPITDYIINSDSVIIVQIKLPDGLQVIEKTAGVLRKAYSQSDTSTAIIANVRCRLIKGSYVYFAYLKKDTGQKPVTGDLLYTYVQAPGTYDGLLFNVIKHSIVLNSVEDKLIADMNTVLKLKTAADEKKIIDLLVADTRFTGTEMPRQGGSQDVAIYDGRFQGKRLFASMQAVDNDDVSVFLKYINARPEKYAGNTWKFSEIMATWMVAGAPTVKE